MHRLNQIIIMLSKFIKHYDDYSILTKCNSNSSGCQNYPHFEKWLLKRSLITAEIRTALNAGQTLV